jgi:hypothetical protein
VTALTPTATAKKSNRYQDFQLQPPGTPFKWLIDKLEASEDEAVENNLLHH